ncbi:MAG: hypothetical protein K0R00_536 [Herbinix sp.]|nr:hypothetical protein [Herbinix sp.]
MEKKSFRILLRLFALGLALIGVTLSSKQIAVAAVADPVKVVAVEYYEEQIFVLNNGNSKTMIDISWLPESVENILVVRGDENKTQSRIIIGAKPTKLGITINYGNMSLVEAGEPIGAMVNIMSSVGTGDDPITFDDLEWRKGTNGQWRNSSELNVELFEKYLTKGTNLYFRIRAVDHQATLSQSTKNIDLNERRKEGESGGLMAFDSTTLTIGTNYPDGRMGRRFSSEVKVKVVKQAPSMVTGIDGSKFFAAIKYGNEYRVTTNGTTSGWTSVTDRTVKSLSLSTILKDATKDGTIKANAFPAMKIEVRNYATTKAVASKITEINLSAQRTLESTVIKGKLPANPSDADKAKIYVYYNGDKNIGITIPLATTSNAYEYCITKKNETIDISKASWTAITKGTEVKVLPSKAVDGGTLYIRQKEIKSQAATSTKPAVGYQLASTYVTHPISYPSVPMIAKVTHVFTKGYSGDYVFDVVLSVNNKEPFETGIKTIKLGTKEIEFTPAAPITSGTTTTMQVTLKKSSLEALANCIGKPITITFMNGTIDKTSIKLTIQNPSSAGTLSITNTKGTNTGTTSFTVGTAKASSNTWCYVLTETVITNVTTMDTLTKIAPGKTPNNFTTNTVDNIPITATDKYITIFELDKDGLVVKYKSILLTSDMIKS